MWRWEQVRRAICILQKALFLRSPVTLGLPHSWPGTAMLWSSLPFYLRGPGHFSMYRSGSGSPAIKVQLEDHLFQAFSGSYSYLS